MHRDFEHKENGRLGTACDLVEDHSSHAATGEETQLNWQVGETAKPAVAGGELTLSPGRLRVWGVRSALSLVDQGMTSGAGFGVNLLLARWMPTEVYGAFAVAFAAFLFISGFHNVLLLEPLSVLGPSRYAQMLPAYFRVQIIIHTVLVGALSALALLANLAWWWIFPRSPLSSAIAGAALALPCLLLLWLLRRMCYVVHRPSIAAAGSTLYLALVIAGLLGLWHLGWLGSFTAFLTMGSGSLIATGLLLWHLNLMNHSEIVARAVSWRRALRESWNYARWLVASTALYSVVSQIQLFLTAAYLGLAQAGILRAILLPASAMTQAVTAADMVVLPGLSRDFGRGSTRLISQKAQAVSLLLGGSALGFVALLSVFAGRTEHLLYGGKYAGYAWLIPILALIPSANGFAVGYSTAIRASQRADYNLFATSVSAPVAVLSGLLSIPRWGLAGAAASMVIGSFCYMLCNCVTFYRFSRKAQPQLRTT